MKMHRGSTLTYAVALASLVLAGCGDNTPTSPGIQPEIINIVDSFEYQVSDIRNYSGTATYAWENTGTGANIDLSTAGDAGDAVLTVHDDAGTPVFTGTLDADGTFATNRGIAGNWTLRVDYTSFSGTVNFRLEKTT